MHVALLSRIIILQTAFKDILQRWKITIRPLFTFISKRKSDFSHSKFGRNKTLENISAFTVYEPWHDKSNGMSECAKRKESDQLGHLPSWNRLLAVHTQYVHKLQCLFYEESRLIRLIWCLAWFLSLVLIDTGMAEAARLDCFSGQYFKFTSTLQCDE